MLSCVEFIWENCNDKRENSLCGESITRQTHRDKTPWRECSINAFNVIPFAIVSNSREAIFECGPELGQTLSASFAPN